MCGIAGYVVDSGAVDSSIIERLLGQLDHRGPDTSGYFTGTRGVVGQTRLSIIDVTRGDPPLTTEDGSIAAVLNGEIYNFLTLHKELLEDGHRFSSECDTEVIAHLAEQTSPVDMCRKLRGMFALAIWDENAQQLVLARDRLGKKPLYYWYRNGTLVFGSEIKAVLAHPAVTRDFNTSALPAYLTFGYVPTPQTFFTDIYSLPPGHLLAHRPGHEPVVTPYWSFPSPDRIGDLETAPLDVQALEVRRLLLNAVERRLVADVPLGAFLSGGLDSATVVGLMAELSDVPVRTFSIGFDDDEGFDERPFSRLVSARFATDHTEFVVRPDAIGLIDRLVWHYDQPFGDSSAIPTFLLAEQTRAEVTVALSGDGGDELFAGYSRFPATLGLERYKQVPALVRLPVEAIIKKLPAAHEGSAAARLRRLVDRADLDTPELVISWITYSRDARARSLVGRDFDDVVAGFTHVWAQSQGAPLLHRLLRLNIETYLLDDLLPKVDRMSMAHGLEIRCPLLDTDLLELTMRLPPSAFVRGGRTKRVLRHAIRDLLPGEILTRPKRGFAVPLARWLRTDMSDFVRGKLLSSASRVRNHLQPGAIDSVAGLHLEGRVDYADLMWALLTLETFLEKEDW